MQSLRNKVQLIGRVGQDPEILALESGKKLAKFSLATNENYTDANGVRVEKTEWHHIVFWNKPADIIEQYVHIGDQIAVEGKLTTHSWEDINGMKHYNTHIMGNEFVLLNSRRGKEVS